MKTEVRIPQFISKYFNSFETKEQKDEALSRFRGWMRNDYTLLFLEDLEAKLEKLIQEDEKETGFVSRFQFNYKQAHNRAKRSILRDLIKVLNQEV